VALSEASSSSNFPPQVVASGSGVKKSWLFFLGKKPTPAPPAGRRASAEVGVDMERPDVAAERATVAQLKDGVGGNVIVCKNLSKVFPARDGNPPKVAVKSLALAVPRGECFGMLGPNGAGKTTSINMMVGFLQPSGGSALIEGLDIRTDMNKIYSIMGVCPQHESAPPPPHFLLTFYLGR
jgi:ABC-type glutathione transport system ATPase component